MRQITGWCVGLLAMGLGAFGCGGSDDHKVVVVHEGGAGAAAEATSPALGPEDCVGAVTELSLSQPEGADVWGGLTLLEFQVEGSKVRSFEAQVFDPALEAWRIDYLPVGFSGQRDDGTYLLAVQVSPSELAQDGEHKVRVRPSQSGCPEADWVESETFVLGHPFESTSWQGSIPGDHFEGDLRIEGESGMHDMTIAGADLSVSFGDDGVFSETVTFELSTEDAGPYDGCSLAFTFEGSWRHESASYGSGTLRLSELNLVSTEGSVCQGGPALADMRISDPDEAALLVTGPTTHYLSIDYLPTLAATPGVPVWSSDVLREVLSLLPQLLAYEIPANGAGGSAPYIAEGDGYVQVAEVELEKQE